MMRKEVPTWVAVVVILVVLVVIAGIYMAFMRPKEPTERPPIEMGGHAGPMKMKEMGGGQAPAPQPPR
ncbi:hypothetical protein GG496_001422 [Candidatus Fervidibacteria bacterium JGI MDM2 JNZ-1-D12]